MSEPDGAFLKLRIARDKLVDWLDSAPTLASGWSDWRRMGGEIWEAGANRPFEEISNAALAEMLAQSDAVIGRYPTVRDALRDNLDADTPPYLKHASFDAAQGVFVAGTAVFAEERTLGMAFLAIARSAASRLGADEHGVAVIHNYVWGGEEEQVTRSALRLGPGLNSAFLGPENQPQAAAEFRAIADEMVEGFDGGPPRVFNEIDDLR